MSRLMKNSYNGLFFFEVGEDVKVIDVDSGADLKTHALSNLVDTIDLSPQALVPKMTSNTTPEGECGASSVYSGFLAYYAFNGSTYDRTQTGRYWYANGGTNQYVYYKFTQPRIITNFQFKSSEASGTADNNTTCVLIASNDGTNWTELQTYNIVAKAIMAGVLYELDVDKSNRGSYLYYGIKFPSWPQGNAQVGEAQFYGY